MRVAACVLLVFGWLGLPASGRAMVLERPVVVAAPHTVAAELADARVATVWFSERESGSWQWIEVSRSDGSERVVLTPLPGVGPDRAVWDLAWSPDGSRLAYVMEFGDNGSRSLYVVNADGTGRFRLATKLGAIDFISWAPDSSLLAFTAVSHRFPARRSNSGLFRVNADGSGLQRLPALPPGAPRPPPEPTDSLFRPVGWQSAINGLLYAFSSLPPRIDRSDLYRLDLDTMQATRLRSSQVPTYYTLAPSAEQLAAVQIVRRGGFRVFVLDANASSRRAIYATRESVFATGLGWLGDDALLLLDSTAGDEEQHLRLIDSQSGIATLVAATTYPTYFSSLDVSRDGELIAYLLNEYGPQPSRRIEVHHGDGSHLATLPIAATTQPLALLSWATIYLG